MPDDAIHHHLLTIRDYIRYGASRMNQAQVHFGHGTDNGLDEAAALVLHTLDLPPDLHSEYFSARLVPEERRRVLALLERRVQERIPAAYLMHQAWFMGLPFYVDERVLVPRSPSAELIEGQFVPWVDPQRVEAILDLCTGSGCIGIACAYAFADARVDLADIDPGALEVARRNVADHGLDERVEVIRSDLFDALNGRRYQLIVSNPPYVARQEYRQLPPEYHHEPRLGLESGADGLEAVGRILGQAADYLTDDGVLVVEVGSAQQALEETFGEVPFTWLEFVRGGEGVFLLTRDQLVQYRERFE
ncbi:MAG: 50S ribosomal protein L3 N(5)-glutamine methyltransferase [Candidatus Competibacteraceae bacterium]|nr:50S ribosomal protein L3 N(5)-glutamine methyltransferase [Candidatus Competibacteraceae bacterium]